MSAVASPSAIAISAARRLTKAQRHHVRRGAIGGDFQIRTVRTLIANGIMHIVPDSPDGRYGPCVLTEFGQSVQMALNELALA